MSTSCSASATLAGLGHETEVPRTGQEDALLTNHSVKALREVADELSGVGHLCHPLHLLGCNCGEAVCTIGNVLCDGAGKQDWLLQLEMEHICQELQPTSGRHHGH